MLYMVMVIEKMHIITLKSLWQHNYLIRCCRSCCRYRRSSAQCSLPKTDNCSVLCFDLHYLFWIWYENLSTVCLDVIYYEYTV